MKIELFLLFSWLEFILRECKGIKNVVQKKKKILESLISQGLFELNLLNKIDCKNKCVVMNFSELIYEDEFIMFMRS